MAIVAGIFAACARVSPCAPPFAADPGRTEAIEALARTRVPSTVCYGTVPERGLRVEGGNLRLDRGTDDRLLAARVVHLLGHVAPAGAGPDCHDRLVDEEARVWTAELAHRAALGVTDPHCPVADALGPTPGVDAVRQWIAADPGGPAAGLRHSHRRRCPPSSLPEVSSRPAPEPP